MRKTVALSGMGWNEWMKWISDMISDVACVEYTDLDLHIHFSYIHMS